MSNPQHKMLKLVDLNGFNNKYITSLMRLGVEYVDDFYFMACGDKEATKNQLRIDDSELVRLMMLAEAVLDKDTIERAKNPKSSSEGFIYDDS